MLAASIHIKHKLEVKIKNKIKILLLCILWPFVLIGSSGHLIFNKKDMKQKTIKKEIYFKGIGVHSGLYSTVTLKPAAPDSGIIIKNTASDESCLKVGDVVPVESKFATILSNDEWQIGTLEHLMAAISCVGIDNLIIEIEGIEVPILDGSALPFVRKILKVGFTQQDSKKLFLTPKKKLVFEDEKDGRYLEFLPAEERDGKKDKNLYIDYFASFENPIVGEGQINCCLTKNYFCKEIAPARTFGFLEQLPMMQKLGLAKGASLENTVVIGEKGYLNARRFDDEFVRHKLLDMLGDLALMGAQLSGKIVAKKTGHSFNRLVVENYLSNSDDWMFF
jgi:UDP-3-O-[3-hydroxymyristoyl] N-acetylglucosamine deacetylase